MVQLVCVSIYLQYCLSLSGAAEALLGHEPVRYVSLNMDIQSFVIWGWFLDYYAKFLSVSFQNVTELLRSWE